LDLVLCEASNDLLELIEDQKVGPTEFFYPALAFINRQFHPGLTHVLYETASEEWWPALSDGDSLEDDLGPLARL
jgi:hypothetical protein